MLDMDLVKKGAGVPRLGLLDTARVLLQLLKEHLDVFRKYRWTDEDTRDYIATIELVESKRAAAVEARHAAKVRRDEEQAAVTDAKAYKRQVIDGFEYLYEWGKVDAHTVEAVTRSGKLRRSPILLAGYLNDIRPHVAAHNEDLKRFFPENDPLCLLDELHERLTTTQAVQEAAWETLPLETLKVYEAKGRLLRYVNSIIRIARIAFDGNAELRSRFNKDRIFRSRKRRSKSTVEPVSTEEPTETSV